MFSRQAPVQRAPLYNLAIGGSFSGLDCSSGCAVLSGAFQNDSSYDSVDEVGQ